MQVTEKKQEAQPLALDEVWFSDNWCSDKTSGDDLEKRRGAGERKEGREGGGSVHVDACIQCLSRQ